MTQTPFTAIDALISRIERLPKRPPSAAAVKAARKELETLRSMLARFRADDRPSMHSAKRALSPRAEAVAFVSYMQEFVGAGEYRWSGPGGIWDRYISFCERISLRRSLAPNVFAEALIDLLGADCVRRESDYTFDRRRRKLTVYLIPVAQSSCAFVAPDPFPGSDTTWTAPKVIR